MKAVNKIGVCIYVDWWNSLLTTKMKKP